MASVNKSMDVKKISRRSRIRRAVRSLSDGAAFELLESRTLMSLLGIDLGTNAAQIQTGSSGAIQYAPINQNYTISTTDLTLVQPNGQNDPITSDPSNGVSRAGSVQILVSSSGNLIAGNGATGADISLQGDVTINGTPYDGTLLTGSVLQFGYQFKNTGAPAPLPAGSATFDFRFRATGGLLQSMYFQGADIGMVISGTSSTPFSSGLIGPTENWNAFDLTNNVKGFVGPVTPLKVNPSILTTASFQNGTGNVVGSAVPEDSAVLSGGYQESGPITFTLTAPDGTTADTEIIAPTGDGTYTTSNANVATQVGTYTWHVSYAGDAFNNPANDQGGPAEQVTVVPASPAISTLASETTNVVGMALLSDSVTVTGGDNPTGTVTFTLTQPDGSTISAGSGTINGDGTYAGPAGILATQVGTYTFHATYAGDSLNNGAIDSGANESVTTVKATPTISTNATETSNVAGTALLSDSVTVAGGDNPTGLVTFTVTQPDGTTVPAGSVTINGDGTYPLLPPVLATEVGTYTFHASYAGDSLNNGALDNGANESAATAPAQPQIVTSASSNSGNVVGSALLADTATISGGFNETGTISFSLTQPDGSTVPVGSIAVHNDGNYNSPSFLATEVGTYTWHATYSGDTLNNGAVDNGVNESFTTVKATPAINTLASETTNVVGTALLSDSVVVTGGDNPAGMVTFTLTQPDGTTVPAGSVTINGDGTYPLLPPILATQVGTYTFHATYAGDSLNNGAVDNGANESVTTVKAGPTISTNATESTNVVGTALLSDSVTVTGGDHPTGIVTFTLTMPDGTTVPAGTATINGDGTYVGPTSILATEVGTYTFHATYAGDSLNNGAVDNGNNESVSTIKASPSISTLASENGNVVGTATASDSVTVTGGDNPTGTVTFTLTAPNGTTASTQAVTITGDGVYTVPAAVLATQVGTYTWSASYAGDSLNNGAVDQGGSAEQVAFVSPPGGKISGTKYNDLTGNGFSADDTPLGGITIDLYKGTSAIGTPFKTTVTAADGTYSFSNLPNGTYFVQESVPANSVETGGLLGYVVTVSGGSNSTGNNFDDFLEECDLSKFSCIYYVIDGTKVVTSLSGNVKPGDEVTAYITVAPHYSDEVTLVSYIAPDGYFNANDASQQVIFDEKTVSFSTGSTPQTISLGPVQIPLCDYQIDFVCGPAIDHLGPAGSNIFYHQENRFFDSSNGGNQQCNTSGYSVAGIVYCDDNVNGVLDSGDELLPGAIVSITDSGGNAVKNLFGVTVGSETTGANGSYSFENLPAGTYIVTVTTPAPGHVAEQGSGGSVTLNTTTVTVGPGKGNNPAGNATNENFAEIQLGAIEGFVFDDTNCDGNIDWNEAGIQGVTITLSGVNYLGKTVTITNTTDDSGEYIFQGLLPGTYKLTETQPAGFTEGKNCCGTFDGNQCGSLSGSDTINGINVAGCDNQGINFNFGEKNNTSEGRGAAATIGFWHNKNGQALLLSLNGGPNATGLGNWLATMFPNMYGANAKYDFAGWTNQQIANFYITNDFNVTGVKLNAQVLSAAFACYVTSSNLAGSGAASYGFTVTASGSGYDLINVGTNGAAFGVANYTSISILQALEATDADASNGVLYATSETVLGKTYSASTLQSMANTVYSNINQKGDIT